MMGQLASTEDYGIDPMTGMPNVPSPGAQSVFNSAVKSIGETLATPGATMEKNPYPQDSELWHAYEDQRGKQMGAFARDMALNTMGTGAIVGAPLKAGEAILGAGAVRGKKGMGDVAEPPSALWQHQVPDTQSVPVTGSLNPLDNVPVTYNGKPLHQLTPDEMHAFGQRYGVNNLGPLSPVQGVRGKPVEYSGIGPPSPPKDFSVPGGTEGKWTYADLLHMKANPIDPFTMDRATHAAMQSKLGRTMTPEGGASPSQIWNGLVFGMTSPNSPLFPNQLAMSRLRLRTPQMLDDLAGMVPWELGAEVTPQARKLVNDQIAKRFSLGAAPEGLGVRGTADYSRIGELAKMFQKDPDFFRKMPEESWGQAVERIASQVPGLSMKTGSLGTVWQDPANAAISAIDRHMARLLEQRGGLFASPAERTAWEQQALGRWNLRERKSGGDVAGDFDDLLKKSGSDGFIGEMLLDHVGKALEPKLRLAGGEINPRVPEHLAKTKWAHEPEKVSVMGQAYKRALDENQTIASENGLNLFMSQWMEWDRIRRRFEPHENMFPGLEKLPAPSVNQLREVDAAHRATGHKTYDLDAAGRLNPTRPLLDRLPASMGYLGMGSLAAVPVLNEVLNEKRAR